jgi:hypothetical protein
MKQPRDRKEPERRRDRASGMEHDPAISGSKPTLGRSMERDRDSFRPSSDESRSRSGNNDHIIR